MVPSLRSGRPSVGLEFRIYNFVFIVLKNTLLKKIFIIIPAGIIITGAFFGGIFVGVNQKSSIDYAVNIIRKSPENPTLTQGRAETDFNLFWDVWGRLENGFVDKTKIEPQKMVFGAIDGLVKSLEDPYTVFLPPEETKRFNDDIKGEFGGIGAEIGIKKGILTIIAPLKDSPSEKAGLKPGDKVLKINGTSTIDLTLDKAVSFIRGEKGTQVTLTIARGDDLGDNKEIKITRDIIRIPVIETKKLANGIFYIHLFNFNENSTSEFKNGLIEMQQSGSGKLILDLRNNPGGFLNAAIDIASWFISAGEIVAREKMANSEEINYRSYGYRFLEKTPVVILVNQGSASASEIVAGALRDQRNIKLVGDKTFGKGSVQELQKLPQNASLKLTIAKWLTPTGHSINDAGLEPDIKMEISKEDNDNNKDPQLEKAIELIKEM